ncbi:TonB-dependent receptor [Rhizorhabdus dicambivorans]|uniref:TonB-dependent receptor n=1 Tax=Rhizorhabdus dicambivorans TaxID=1850238 RepID=A0A2A4FPN5_9SPHN|nr:TonB-dependent receptor [Rhizorhabdus dicambivorans]ATE65720.1 TonB-dependent receptor [Rhizorhabdus dicambivorans]PCE39660.1 TonB-dependent receptor [Rhizorhabdus dicambivorans]
MDGYVYNRALDQNGPHERTGQGRISARWEPTSSFRSDNRIDYFRSRVNNAYSFVLTGCPVSAPIVETAAKSCGSYLAAGGRPYTSLGYESVSPKNFANVNFWEASSTNALDVGPGTLSAITGYINQKVNALTQPIPLPLPGAVGGNQGSPVYLGERFHQFSQEVRYQPQTGGTFEYMFGGYYSNSHLYNYNYVGFFFLPFGAFSPLGTTNAATQVTGSPKLHEDDRTLSAFASLTVRPIARVRINLGARYSNIHKEAVRDVTLGTSTGAVPSTYVPFTSPTLNVYAGILGADLGQFAQLKRTDDKFMPSAGIQYDAAKDVMLYATYSKGFKAGGYSAASLANSFEPETVNAYEVGMKSRFLDRRLTLNTAVFRSDYSNLQESTIVISNAGTIISLVQNAAKSRSQGVEVSASCRVSTEFTLSADVAGLDSKYTTYTNGACTVLGNFLSTTCRQDLSGKRRPYAPKWSGNIAANISLPVASDYRLHIDPVMYFSSKFFESATADPLLTQKGYAKFDLRLGVGPSNERWMLSVIGKNLSNVATSGFRQQVTNSSAVYALPDRPRAIALQFSIKG